MMYKLGTGAKKRKKKTVILAIISDVSK